MPALQTIPRVIIGLMHTLFALGPPHPRRLRPAHDTYHLFWDGQLGINGRGKRVDEFGPVVIPQPQHGAAVGAEVPLGGAAFLVGCTAVFDTVVFPGLMLVVVTRRQGRARMEGGRRYLMRSLPVVIFRLSAMPPRFTLPL